MYVNWRLALFMAVILAGLIAYWWHTRVPVVITPVNEIPVREVIVPVVVSPTAP